MAFMNTYRLVNLTITGKSPLSIGNASSFMVDFPARHVSFGGGGNRDPYNGLFCSPCSCVIPYVNIGDYEYT